MVHGFRAGSRRANLSIVACLLCSTAAGVLSQTPPAVSRTTGPNARPCPSNAAIQGYDNTTTLTLDMFEMHNEILAALIKGGNENPTHDDYFAYQKGKAYVFTLCPQTVFDLGVNQTMYPIIPWLPNSLILCGEKGNPADNCVIKSGRFQVVFEDDHRAENITLAGITFTESSFISVAAYGHFLSYAEFMYCVWENNAGSSILVDMNFDPNMEFWFEPDQRRRTEGHLSKFASLDDYSFDTETAASRALDRVAATAGKRKMQGDGLFPSMATVFFSCMFRNNRIVYFGIFNQGGLLELITSAFEFNQGAAMVANVDRAKLWMHSQTSFSHNADILGPVFLDATSELMYNEDTVGESNTATDSSGMSVADACDAIFKEQAQNSNCLQGEVCRGECCNFGVSDCFQDEADDQEKTVDVNIPDNVNTQESGGGGGGGSSGCDTTCIVIATVVPFCTVSIIVFGIWLVLRRNNGGGGNVATQAQAAAPPQSPSPLTSPSSPAEEAAPTLEMKSFEMTADDVHHMA